MELINTNLNYFDGQNRYKQWFSLSEPKFSNPLSPSPLVEKDWKIKKINFDTKIKFLKTKGINNL